MNFAISPRGIGRFRVNAFTQLGRTGIVIRVIQSKIPNFEELQLPPVMAELAMTMRGLIIMVGATGSGKSTTLASMIGYRNENSYGHIVTIEDPVEFVHPHRNCIVTHREVGVDTHGWEIALKNTLRQAPDVIMIGEVRDRETMEHAVAFAETGHLCLATLHANSANQALDRIINFFPEERRQQVLMDLSLNLKALISQRLVPIEGGKGRVAAVEVLINSPLISDLIFKGDVSEIKEIMKKSRELGMQTFDQHLFDLYEQGRIDLRGCAAQCRLGQRPAAQHQAERNADQAARRFGLRAPGPGLILPPAVPAIPDSRRHGSRSRRPTSPCAALPLRGDLGLRTFGRGLGEVARPEVELVLVDRALVAAPADRAGARARRSSAARASPRRTPAATPTAPSRWAERPAARHRRRGTDAAGSAAACRTCSPTIRGSGGRGGR